MGDAGYILGGPVLREILAFGTVGTFTAPAYHYPLPGEIFSILLQHRRALILTPATLLTCPSFRGLRHGKSIAGWSDNPGIHGTTILLDVAKQEPRLPYRTKNYA